MRLNMRNSTASLQINSPQLKLWNWKWKGLEVTKTKKEKERCRHKGWERARQTSRGGAEGGEAAGGALGGGDPRGGALHGLLLGEVLDEGGQVPHHGAGLRELAARTPVVVLAQARLEARELRGHRSREEPQLRRLVARRGLHCWSRVHVGFRVQGTLPAFRGGGERAVSRREERGGSELAC